MNLEGSESGNQRLNDSGNRLLRKGQITKEDNQCNNNIREIKTIGEKESEKSVS